MSHRRTMWSGFPWRWFAASVVVVVTLVGWHQFFFLTDDAYIEFRYASNLLLGRGLTWNPLPFAPVEGYTSLSWVLILAGVWWLLGVEPPQSAGVLSLLCGLWTLRLVWEMAWQVRPPSSPRTPGAEVPARGRAWLVAFTFVGILSNRTFFTWLSSGLDAAAFNLCFTWWVYELWRLGRGRGRLFRVALAAAVAALTRPDGLLCVASTVLVAAWLLSRVRRGANGGWGERARTVRELIPLSAVAAHVLWRWSTYGAWLPNTYYAKHVAPWPEAGFRYLLSFLVENGLWVWLAAAFCWALATVVRRGRAIPRDVWAGAPVAIAGATVLAHLAYSCFVIGGDHFEYRVLSMTVPLGFLTLGWFGGSLVSRPLLLSVAAAGVFAVSWPIQWTHWRLTKDLVTREATFALAKPVADAFPSVLRGTVAHWDELQKWLIGHAVGVRHQEHKVFHRFQVDLHPPREVGQKLSWAARPVSDQLCVGVPGWVMPNVAIIDRLGLNDAVIARTPAVRPDDRRMAHDRQPPPGYIECFHPNVELGPPPHARDRSLSDGDITECERRFRLAVESLRRQSER